MWIGVITLFPDMFRAITDYGVIGRAIQKGLLLIKFWNPREFSNDRHHNIDGYLYGGGAGMLMMIQPLKDAISSAKVEAGGSKEDIRVIYLSPQGRKLDQQGVDELFSYSKLILVCGRYKGIDERLIITEIDEEWSIGDYILSGGELAAMVLIDSIARFIPGVLNRVVSAREDSFSNEKGILNPPYYTRPSVFEGMFVPNVLLSGNHNDISQWRLKESLGRTWFKRPELLRKSVLTDEEKKLLLEFQRELLLKLTYEIC